jgi:hypothetical protein
MVLTRILNSYWSFRMSRLQRAYEAPGLSDGERNRLIEEYHFYRARINISRMPESPYQTRSEDPSFRKAFSSIKSLEGFGRRDLLGKLGVNNTWNAFAIELLMDGPELALVSI